MSMTERYLLLILVLLIRDISLQLDEYDKQMEDMYDRLPPPWGTYQ
jgi:hypothetical protein